MSSFFLAIGATSQNVNLKHHFIGCNMLAFCARCKPTKNMNNKIAPAMQAHGGGGKTSATKIQSLFTISPFNAK
jgi:hypothetical protein